MEAIDERRNDLEFDMPSAQMWASAIGTLQGRPTSVEAWASGSWATTPSVLAETAIAAFCLIEDYDECCEQQRVSTSGTAERRFSYVRAVDPHTAKVASTAHSGHHVRRTRAV